jgi:hypothetical protein
LTRRRRSLEIVEEGVEMKTGDIENPPSPKNSVNTMERSREKDLAEEAARVQGLAVERWNFKL